MDNALYSYSPIVERPRLQWPDGKRVAFYIGLNVEHFHVDQPSTSIWPGTSHLAPDPLNHGWRDYGARVGIWRMIEAFDRLGLRASALLNAEVVDRYPQIVEAGLARDWAFLAHGRTNSALHAGFAPGEERAELAAITETLAAATGRRPSGWMGPGLTETFDTPALLAELGYAYVLDWCADDQPFPLATPGMISVPYAIELNDLAFFVGKGFTPEAFGAAIVDQFDQLYEDAATSGRVMALALHPFVAGQPFRHRHLERALAHIASREDVWLTTSDEIAAHYVATTAK